MWFTKRSGQFIHFDASFESHNFGEMEEARVSYITFEMQFTGDDQGEEEMVVEETARAELNDTPMPSHAFGEDFERRVSVANAHYCNGFNQTSKACTVL